jgi:hypothetical protein
MHVTSSADPSLKMRKHLCFGLFFSFLRKSKPGLQRQSNLPQVSPDLGCCNGCLNYTVQLQCLQCAPGRRVTARIKLFHTHRWSGRFSNLGHLRVTQRRCPLSHSLRLEIGLRNREADQSHQMKNRITEKKVANVTNLLSMQGLSDDNHIGTLEK